MKTQHDDKLSRKITPVIKPIKEIKKYKNILWRHHIIIAMDNYIYSDEIKFKTDRSSLIDFLGANWFSNLSLVSKNEEKITKILKKYFLPGANFKNGRLLIKNGMTIKH